MNDYRQRSPSWPASGRWQAWWSAHQKALIPYLFIAPTLAIFTLFVFAPILYASFMSLFEWNGISTPKFTGIDNYLELFNDPIFWRSLRNTLYYGAGVVPLSMALGLLAALGLNWKNLPGRAIFRTVYFLPFVISAVATGTTAGWLFGDSFGIINKLLLALGFEKVRWLSSREMALITVVITTVWIRLGFNMLIYLAGLQAVPNELLESARLDGATPRQQFWHIVLPLLKPTTFLLIILNIIYSFEAFDLVFIMTNGGPGYSTTVLTVFIYNMAFQTQRFGYASAIGLVFMAIIMLITLLQWRFSNEGGRI
ncbi:MAG: sugar ABC transporter permease [Trueperaceae bacterium]|nr:sugar ABC transporter permease [Trueperaceae bacterium]